jgi:hypothetical protein
MLENLWLRTSIPLATAASGPATGPSILPETGASCLLILISFLILLCFEFVSIFYVSLNNELNRLDYYPTNYMHTR